MNNVRPKKLDDFLGQKNIVEQIDIALRSSLYRQNKGEYEVFPHTIMGGPPGLGKTTLASIIANEMDGHIISCISSAITKPEDLQELFLQIENPNTIIFLDEIEQLDRKLSELLHTALEDGVFSAKINNKAVRMPLPKFTMIGATNYLGELPRPFLDRFRIQVNFEPYNTNEIFQIIVNAIKKMKLRATENAAKEIALRSRGIPRIAIRYLENARDVAIAKDEFEYITTKCVLKMFNIHRIDSIGLNDLDRRILKYLKELNKAVGIKALAQGIDEDDSTIEFSEGYLVRSGFVIRGLKGREITEKGINHLKEMSLC
jgi:holliday junction DNA helicase RuvB